MKKSKECIHCKKLFECAGKESQKPCLHFEEREKKEDKKGGMTYRKQKNVHDENM